MSAINSWRKLRKLSRLEVRLLILALLLLPLAGLGIKFFGFRRLYAAMAFVIEKNLIVPSQELGEEEILLPQAYAIARLVNVASDRSLYHPNCLQKSLVLWWLLKLEGIKSNLKIGVRKETGRLEAHAWVEYECYVLNDSSDVDQRFLPFADAIQPVGVKAI